MTVGEAIRKTRNDKGMTQKELAERAGTTEVSVCRWENGNRQMRIDTFIRIADALGSDPFTLFRMVLEVDNAMDKQFGLDRVISICQEYQDVYDSISRHYIYGSYPKDIIATCDKLKVLGFKWGDDLPSGDFRMLKKYHLTNSATKYQPEDDTYYIEWNNGNVGRLQFVTENYWHAVGDEWDEFLSELRSYNPVDYDPLNCHIIYDVENGKKVIADYNDICNRTKEKMRKKIRSIQIEQKKKEIEKLMEEQEVEQDA